MMARSKSSNQWPDTLMQDRNRQLDENLLQRAAGPYMWVKLRRTQYEYIFSTLPSNSDIAQRSLTVHSGLDFFDPDQGSAATWAQTAPRAGHGHGSAADSRDRRR